MGSLYIGENLLDSVAISYDTEDTPTNGSKKPLSSGGAYTAIEALEAVLAGLICGTYSSICIATQLWYVLKVKFPSRVEE